MANYIGNGKFLRDPPPFSSTFPVGARKEDKTGRVAEMTVLGTNTTSAKPHWIAELGGK